MKFRKIMCICSCVIASSMSSFVLNANATYYKTLDPAAYLMLEKNNWNWTSVACSMMNKWVEIPDNCAKKYVYMLVKTAGEHHLNADIKENPFRTTWAVRECINKLRNLKKLPPLNMKIDHYLLENRKIYHSEHRDNEDYNPKSGTSEKEPMQLLKTTKNMDQEVKNIIQEYIINKNVPCYAMVQNKNSPGSNAVLVYGIITNDETNEIQNVLMSNNIRCYEISIEEFCKICQSISTISVY